MKTRVIAGAIILGLGVVTLASARPGTKPAPQPAPTDAPPAASRSADAGLHDRVARLRAEVEMLQIEHDLARQRLASALGDRASGETNPSRQVAREFMRIGAEVVGKGSEFEVAMQEKGDQIWAALDKAVATIPQADVERLRRDFLRVTTDLNRRKIDLIAEEVHLDSSF